MRLVLIATGGTKLGYGHLTRSLTFYKSSTDNFDVFLLPVVEKKDRRLFPKENNIIFTQTLEELISKIRDIKPHAIIWDTVDFDKDAFFEIYSLSSFHVSISPVFTYMYKMNLVFSRNIKQQKLENVEYYLGMEYAIFNNNCKFITDDIYISKLANDGLTIGISMGGGDAPNKTLQVLKTVAKLNCPLTIWVILGEGYSHSYQSLVNTINLNSQHEIILAKTNRSMWDLLSNCNVAILAGGLMLVESIYAGLPSINIFENTTHKKTAGTEFFDKGAAINVGDINDFNSHLRLLESLEEAFKEKSILLSMRERGKGLVDKNASIRIYDILGSKLRNFIK